MTETTDKKRDPPFSYRPPKDLREEFTRRVKASGLSPNAYITQAIFSTEAPRAPRTPPLERALLAQLLAQAAKIRDQLPTGACNDPELQSRIETACEELTAIRAVLLLALGRKP